MTVLYLEALAAIAVSLSILMAGAWLVQQRTGNSGWVDTIWTFSLGLVGAGSALWPVAGAAPNARQWLVAALVAIWSLRLGVHIAIRTAGITDDPRYAAFAREWGVNSPRRMFIFLQNQGLGSIPLVFAIFVAARFPADALRLQDYLGALILLAGIAGEALADAQLKSFRDNPANKGRVCDVGLWRWSRHPNYFFEWFGWLAYPVIALSPDYPWGWATLLAPVFMYWILVHVTGIPPLEAQMLRSRGERYRDYQSRTSQFFPLPPQDDDQKGSGHMSFVSTIIGTAERVPLPDVIIRAAIHRLCSRTATRLATGNAESDACVRRRDGRARHRRVHRRGQRPALRGAGGVLRPCAGPEPQIFLVLLQGAGVDAAGGRGRGAAPDRRARRSRRRPIDPRTRLRLGFAVAVDGAAVSACAGHGGVEFALRSANISRAKRPSAA